MSTYIFSKTPNENKEVEAQLPAGKQAFEVVLLSVHPETTPSLAVDASCDTDKVFLYLKGGVNKTTYGVNFIVQYADGDSEECVAAVTVNEEGIGHYVTSAPDAFMDLVGEMEVGQSALSSVVFTVPGADLQNAWCDWEMLSNENEVLASGNAFECKIKDDGMGDTLIARCVITCPSDVAPSLINTRYQIRYTLHVGDQVFYQFETLRVRGDETVPVGTPDLVELQGAKACLSLVTPQAYSNVKCTLYKDNQELCSIVIPKGRQVASGWLYNAYVDTKSMPASLENYTVIFSYGRGRNQFQESSKLFVITPSIQTACGDVLARVNKARTTLYGSPDLLYPIPTILLWMRRGMDRFNNEYGIFTNFTMTNAKGGIREYWLMWTELMALQAQYLAEGEKAFDYTGAAISLNVDKTQYLDTMANAIKGELDNGFRDYKKNLINKGVTGGDGSEDTTRANAMALARYGISITPTNLYQGYAVMPFVKLTLVP